MPKIVLTAIRRKSGNRASITKLLGTDPERGLTRQPCPLSTTVSGSDERSEHTPKEPGLFEVVSVKADKQNLEFWLVMDINGELDAMHVSDDLAADILRGFDEGRTAKHLRFRVDSVNGRFVWTVRDKSGAVMWGS